MNVKMIFAVILVLIIPQTVFSADTAVDGAEPSVYVPEPTFEFERVVDGTQLMHDFIIQNKGTAPLDITKVKPG